MLTVKDLLGVFSIADLSEDQQDMLLKNAQSTISKASELLAHFGQERKITSGYRPPSYNVSVGGAMNSKHMFCQAIDFEDTDQKLGQWCYDNLGTLREIGLSMESLKYSDPRTGEIKGTHSGYGGKGSWVHLQIVPPKSGHTVFIP